MLRYENKVQLKIYLFKSDFVVINTDTNKVYFAGVELDRCELKLEKDIVQEIIRICEFLEIKHYIIEEEV